MTGKSPIIDHKKCIGCGRCLSVCDNGVFKFRLLSTRPKVVRPGSCPERCDKCIRLCPAMAISFDKNSVTPMVSKNP